VRFVLVAAAKDIRRRMADPAALSIWIGLPLLLGGLLSFISSGAGDAPPRARVLLVDQDNTAVSALVRTAARQGNTPIDLEEVTPDVILMATGSEVALAVAAHDKLVADGVKSRVVSMPSWELFDDQPQDYRDSVLPPAVTARISIEQATTLGWERYVGSAGRTIGMRTFGASAPLKDLQKKFGFEPDNVVKIAKELIAKR
jgi:transketolase